MKADEFINEVQAVWSKSKSGPKLKYRCMFGPRKGRTVPKPSDCFAHPDVAKAQRMKKTRATTGVRQARRAKFTKRTNPVSKLIRRLNKKR